MPGAGIAAPSTDVGASSADRQAFECFMMYHNALRVFEDNLLVVHIVLRVSMFFKCFMMFRLMSCAMIGIRRRFGKSTNISIEVACVIFPQKQ